MERSVAVAIVSAVLCGGAAACAAADGGPADAVAEPPRATAADGTASVIVPPTEPAVSAPPPAGEPERAPAGPTPPVDAVPSEPESVDAPAGEAPVLLAAVLDPLGAGVPAAQDPPPRPLALLEALQRPADPSRRLWIAQAYWKVSTAGAWVRWAGEAVERLELIAPGSDPHDRAVLDVATAAARADLAEARSQLGVAQQELVDLARLPITEPLPWPVDRPLAIPYQTHFDAIFATRIATGRTRAIARTLPARHEALESRAVAVRAAAQAMAMAEADHAKGKRPIEAVVAAHAALVGQQREFLAAVRAYNLDIAEYAMAVADLTVPDDRFVAMLIGAPTPRPAAP
jgi:hypothetical protein